MQTTDTNESSQPEVRTEPAPKRESVLPDDRLYRHMQAKWTVRAGIRRQAESIVGFRGPRWARLPLRVEPEAWIDDRAAESEHQGVFDDSLIAANRFERIGVLRRVLARLVSGEATGAGVLNELVEELAHVARCHERLLSSIALGLSGRADALADHCFSTGVLSIGIAVRLGWSDADVRAAGLAGFLADAGLALLPMPVRTLGRPLTDIELNAVRRHPLYSAALIERIVASTTEAAVPEACQLAIYQHHEREDGSGYPSGVRGNTIHDIAKIVAAADSMAGAVAPRAHRPALAAPTALAEIVRQANAGALDRSSVRALVEFCGIYPPGSRVRLSTGHDALVLCPGSGERLDRPVVRLIGAQGDPIDLSAYREDHLHVVSAMAA